jgi:hypothetical protein
MLLLRLFLRQAAFGNDALTIFGEADDLSHMRIGISSRTFYVKAKK